MTGVVRPFTMSDIDAAANVAGQAFFHDPGLAWILPDPAQRSALAPKLAAAMIRYVMLDGLAEVDDQLRGLALWFPPGSQPPSEAVLRRSGLWDVPQLIGEAVWSRIRGLMADLAHLHRLRRDEPHWYLSLLGVDPAVQRHGIATSLMRSQFERIDRDGMPCYLLAPIPYNVRFYERRGFRVVAEADAAEGRLHLWLMRRAPGQSS